MSTATKKPVASGVGRLSSTESSSSTSPSRQARSATPTSPAVSTPSRTRSIRGAGTPGAQRVARGASSMSLSNATEMMDPEARAETVALIEDLKKRHQDADTTSEQYRKQAEVLQARLDEALKEHAQLEEKVHETEEQLEALRNEKREAARQMREMETIYEAEKSSILKEKEEMATREEEMQAVINRLKETLNQRNADDEYRPSRQSAHPSPSLESGGFAPPSSINRSDSRNNSKLLLQKDKLIESLRLELAEAQIKLVETENQGGGRVHEVERLLMEARMANARLMEDNESYQLLLQEKTLHGDFGKGDFDYMGVSTNHDALSALEGRPSTRGADEATTPGSLADELGAASEDDAHSHIGEEPARRLDNEVRMLKDQNKALTLYINKIIERLLQHQEFEHILDTSTEGAGKAGNVHKELPAPPAEISGVPSLLQRAKSMAIGGGNTRKPRPMSLMHSMPKENSAHNNPDTAPSIPIGLGRSQSTRRGPRPMSEQFVGAAGVVNAMYKGPDGPLSPTLSNPRHSQTFFSGASGSSRTASYAGNGAPSAGNFPGMRSETSSVSGDSGSVAGDGVSSTTQSPPRTLNGGEKQGNATFTGNKPRPLRLVQEQTDTKTDNKRASWLPSFSGWGANNSG
ncbi:uncharacterized protein B0I36DRAFT_386421 [Microdochium trichocladiopsis]|uniref:M protein, serotype 2.1 n=1 Tax=Microdochium trichocladiopsis TaxID=1682393 RepID=A0A9P9BMA4_9PEZI|nr:uncharacterized protein B0I36DRAFT_386421 [Microdochium trichocladiopsis]KAH7026083.1 hypothetical protein B0I36DRAFT_386421 [Microdochium trichocladiopsis]